MPVLLTIGAVAVIALLMVIGIRSPWDPSPGPVPPSGMSVPAPTPTPLPPSLWVLLAVGPAATILLGAISAATERTWIAVTGYVVLGLSWAAWQTVALWASSDTMPGRVVAVLRPASFVLGFVAAAATDSAWWVLVGLIGYLGIMPLVDAAERIRNRPSTKDATSQTLPGKDDTRR